MFSRSVARRIILLASLLIACRGPETSKPAAPPPAAPPTVAVSYCSFITNEAASAAMGQATVAHPGDETGANCFLQPVSGTGLGAVIRIVDDTANFYKLTTEPDAVMVDVGDRGVWMTTTRELHVVDGKRTVVVKMSNEPMKMSEMTGKAQAIARAILAHR